MLLVFFCSTRFNALLFLCTLLIEIHVVQIELEVTPDALQVIARQALRFKTGARALRSILVLMLSCSNNICTTCPLFIITSASLSHTYEYYLTSIC